jgi:AcrR family transcriptional regulator
MPRPRATPTPEPAADPRPRWERRKASRPAELVAAALELFVEKGYAATRLDDVAAHAGVSKGTLYLYFGNKEDLFKAVVRENVVALIDRSASEMQDFDGSAADLLRKLVVDWWRDFGSTTAGGISKLMMAESGNFPEIARFFLAEVIEPWHRLLGEAIARGIKRGEFRAVAIPEFVQVMTAPMVMLTLWKRSFGPCSARPLDADAYIETLLDTFLTALARPARPAAAPVAAARAPGARTAGRR